MMKGFSIAQRKFLAEFLGNFSLIWIAGSFVSPFLAREIYNINLIIGIIVASVAFWLAISLLKGVK